MRTRLIRRKIPVPSNPGSMVVWILTGIAIASFAFGFALRPADGPPGAIATPPTLSLAFPSAAPRQLAIYSFLKQESGQSAELAVSANGTFAPGQTMAHWRLDIQSFTGAICSPADPAVSVDREPGNELLTGSSKIPADAGEPFLTLELCWNSGAPLAVNGSYVSAALPPIWAPAGQPGTVTRSLVLSGTSLSSYSLAGGIAPTGVDSRSWIWTSDLGLSFEDQARSDIPIVASSLPGIQRDNRNIFYSGVLFGIAGGAAVGIVPAWLDAADRRKAMKHPEVKP